MPVPDRNTFESAYSGQAPWDIGFLHTSTGDAWAVDNSVAWSLGNAHQPILERARERLVTLDALLQLGRVCVKCPLLHTEERNDVLVCGYTGRNNQGRGLPSFPPLLLAADLAE